MSDAVLQVADIGTARSGIRLCWIAQTATQRWQAEALTETAGTVMAMDECNGIPSRNDLSAAGAYVLAITITAPIAVKPVGVLNAGNYLYCGSARGPSGLRARLSRHVRCAKSIRWHVDQLTTQGFVKGVWTFPGGDECALVKRLSFLQTPIQGFRSSDCRQCDSHLLDWPNWLSQGDLDRALASRMAELQSLRQSLLLASSRPLAVPQPMNLVLQMELLTLQFDDLQIVDRPVFQCLFNFLLDHIVSAIQFG